LIFLLINRVNSENNLNLKVNKSDNENNNKNILDKNNIYIIGLIKTVLNTYNSKYKLENDTKELLDIFYLFRNMDKIKNIRIISIIIYIIISMENFLYTNSDIIDLLKKYSDENKSSDIVYHNLNIKMPLLTDMLLEKAFVLSLENKNIINKSNYKSTSLNTQLNTTSEGPIINLIVD
jgi:hypothetical protein